MTKPNTSPVPSPKGTRDLYPDQLARQNYITRLWRDTALRHGFEEVNGPTFEMLELYTRKSGEGIVGELFRFRREGGEDDYALRPEFTPTLARMYAAKAASLPSPTKWFSIGPYFRAEKPQRGRLREFLQWNVDVLGDASQSSRQALDAETICVLTDSLTQAGIKAKGGLVSDPVRVFVNDRSLVQGWLLVRGARTEQIPDALNIMDRRDKMTARELNDALQKAGLPPKAAALVAESEMELIRAGQSELKLLSSRSGVLDWSSMTPLDDALTSLQIDNWVHFNSSIVRGLAYYTGTVFEVIAEGERAIAGGGRYDNLIELFGGPPTPAVGFGMGDVVLGLLLDDKGLMPQGAELMDALGRPGASLRPEAFVVAATEEEDHLVEPLLANLRRGVENEGFDGKPWAADRYAVRPMHARRTYKTTRNLKKVLNDAEKQHAKFAVVLEAGTVRVRDLDKREDVPGDFSVDPASEAYLGKTIAQRLA
jgi:histidyl-tRNA synthetase